MPRSCLQITLPIIPGTSTSPSPFNSKPQQPSQITSVYLPFPKPPSLGFLPKWTSSASATPCSRPSSHSSPSPPRRNPTSQSPICRNTKRAASARPSTRGRRRSSCSRRGLRRGVVRGLYVPFSPLLSFTSVFLILRFLHFPFPFVYFSVLNRKTEGERNLIR